MKKKLLVIVGPTASGKSDLAVKLAKKHDGEVVSADSRQVYKGLDIGTGKITLEEMQGIPHHLLDVVDPQEQFDVTQFKKLADEAIADIHARGKLPILAGGTGFYIEAVVDGIVPPEVPPNKELREQLEKKGVAELFEELKEKDPKRAKVMDPENKRRIIRAFEIIDTLGTVPPREKNERFDTTIIGIDVDPDTLKQKIYDRLISRIDAGMIEEAKKLHENGLSRERMDQLGLEYRYLAKHLQGELSKEEMIEVLSHKIWQYAKRQLLWFKRDPRIDWITISAGAEGIEPPTRVLETPIMPLN